MSTMPIDLQVLFTKASEHSENIARSANAAQSGQVAGYEKIHKQSQVVNETVNNLEQYAEDFTKINAESKKQQGQQQEQNKKQSKTPASPEEYKRAPKEEGTGKIIDIVD